MPSDHLQAHIGAYRQTCTPARPHTRRRHAQTHAVAVAPPSRSLPRAAPRRAWARAARGGFPWRTEPVTPHAGRLQPPRASPPKKTGPPDPDPMSSHPPAAPAELGGETHKVSRNGARTQVLLQARKLHVYGSGTVGAFWLDQCHPPRSPADHATHDPFADRPFEL